MPRTETPPARRRLSGENAARSGVQGAAKQARPSRKVTIADVAHAAGVSTTAVSYAFSGKGRMPEMTRKLVLDTAQQLGYEANYYAQRIMGGCTKTIASFAGTIEGVAGAKVTRIQQELIRRGFSAPLHGLGYVSPEECAEAMKQLRRQRPRAIVFSGGREECVLDELRRFRDDEGIVVCFDNPYPPDFEQTTLDREQGAYQATRHLIEQGHRDIGISTHGHTRSDDSFTQGFQRALQEAGLAYHADWDCPFHPFELAGKALAAHFAQMSERPTALYIVDDRVAITFVTYALRGGFQVPGDVSVITHDQAGIAEHCMVPLTVVSHPTTQIVDSVVAMVQSRIEGSYDGPPRHAVICGSLIERCSVRTVKN